jgi:hypothetical protein
VALVPQVPERTRLARLCKTHTAWTARFKCLNKINFIFIPEILYDVFHICDKLMPTVVCPEFNPFVLHKSP